MRRLPSPVLPAAVVGTIALALTGESSAHAAPPAPPLTALPPAPSALGQVPVVQTAAPATHTVEPGDTVWAIAQRYGLDMGGLQAANGLTGDSIIRPGQVLSLGGAAPEAVAPAPEAAPVTYEVGAGDTVSAIASAHGVSTDAVLSANGLTRDSIIYPGEVLQIPSAAAPGPASVAPVLAPG
ncbi:MAG: LysM repeat, partial [Microbacterium sp.]|nr:LysM repeat [Microbacterium sp.]